MLLTPEPDAWLAVFGRFHIVLLHLPIGLLPGIALLEFGAAMFRKPNPKGSILTLSLLTALTSIAALASGLVLAGEKVDSDLLGEHKIAAIIMTVFCVFLPIFAALKGRKAFRISLLLAVGSSIYAGHLGGSLSHKKDFLFKPLQRAAGIDAAGSKSAAGNAAGEDEELNDVDSSAPKVVTAVDAANEKPDSETPAVAGGNYFEQVIAPIFDKACNDCHNGLDYDGDLDLTNREGILTLGRDEPDRVIVIGNPDKSLLIELCELPRDDDDHMPPVDDEDPGVISELTKEQIAAIRKWILDGCKFD